jgi:hypothetical protein
MVTGRVCPDILATRHWVAALEPDDVLYLCLPAPSSLGSARRDLPMGLDPDPDVLHGDYEAALSPIANAG